MGVMTLETLEGRNLFAPFDATHGKYVVPYALAQYISLMGQPPLSMIQKSEDPDVATCFDEQGNWAVDFPIPVASFEDFVTVLSCKEKTQFLKFIRTIFTWSPRDRAISDELLQDEWLTSPIKTAGYWSDGES
jgi:serine/threonine-protein kinase SRPK3